MMTAKATRGRKLRGARPSRALVAASRRDGLSFGVREGESPLVIRARCESSFRRDAETSARDGRAPRNCGPALSRGIGVVVRRIISMLYRRRAKAASLSAAEKPAVLCIHR